MLKGGIFTLLVVFVGYAWSQVCNEGAARLVGGSSDSEGTVEVCSGGFWFLVCDEGWSQEDAVVVCSSMGLTQFGAQAYGSSLFGSSGHSIKFSNFQCTGSEVNLGQCTNSTTVPATCNEDTLAGAQCGGPKGLCEAAGHTTCCASGCNVGLCWCDISCYGFGDCCADIVNTCPQTGGVTECTGNNLRLVDGFTTSDGRVELCVSGQWSGICDSGWDSNDARVICSQAGYSTSNPIAFTDSYPYGQGDQALVVGNFQCTGNEASWDACTYTSDFSCGHHDEVGVDCNGPCTNNDVRLVNGDATSGRVQFCNNGQWGSIDGEGWSQNDAKVVCSQLGLSQYDYHAYSAVENYGSALYNQVLTSVTCNGDESTLADCAYILTSSPPSDSVASVECANQSLCESAGFSDCCTDSCLVGSCWCDVACHGFGDCCEGIDYICPESDTCVYGDMRLMNGTSLYNGRVEVCIDGQWGTVCDFGWDDKEAEVACRQLGYSTTAASAVTQSYFPPGTGNIVASDFGCFGVETELTSCSFVPSGDCNHQQEAGVFCSEPCTVEGEVRLADGPDAFAGRVEVCVDGYWGTICQNFWSLEDATVVCRELGYSLFGVNAFGNAYYGEGQNLIHWTDVQCTGSETNLALCAKSTSPTCSHDTDVGVMCLPLGTCQQNGFTTCCVSGCNVGGCYCDAACYSFGDCCFDDIAVVCPQPGTSCPDIDVRLINTASSAMGTVEYCSEGSWYTICDIGWTDEEAQVVCKQLGESDYGATAVGNALFGQGTGSVGSENYQCTGTEQSLLDCTSTSPSQCGHTQDAGVICPTYCHDEGAVRIYSGPSDAEGHVQVCNNSVWMTICDEDWCENDAKVVCGQLGYSPNRAEAYGASMYGQTLIQPSYTNVQCLGTEASLADCPSVEIPGGSSTCDYTTVAGVKCFEQAPCESILSQTGCCSSGSCNTGVCYCDSVCHGFGDCCPGIENTCPAPCTDGDSRILDGPSTFEGRVEVCANGGWSAVCDENWDDNDAAVFCRQNNLPSENARAYGDSAYGAGDVPLRVTNFQCTGTEATINECAFTIVSDDNCCNHKDEAGVKCFPQCSDGEVRLVDGSTPLEGRVEICFNGQFTTICDSLWSNNDANVVCGSLGLSQLTGQAHGGAYFGSATGLIGFSNITCSGDEGSILECSYALLPDDCTHDQDAGVVCTSLGPCEGAGFTGCCETGCNLGSCYCDAACHGFGDCCDEIDNTCPQTTCTSGEIRLDSSGLDYPYAGRVELCVNGQWGTVCSDYWDDTDAGVVCQQLEFTQYASFAANSSLFGPGVGLDIVASNFSCNGSEASIYDCPFDSSPDCGHHQDAAVLCNVPCTDGDVRLSNGTTEFEGQVEVCFNKSWYAICDSGWSTEDAQVTCRNLGYSVLNAQAYGNSLFGAGLLPPILNNVVCTGTETNLLECAYDTGELANCPSDSYAGALCQGSILSGGCEEDGHTTCCTGGCFAGTCWCDAACHGFGDCCLDISQTCPQEICNDGDIRVIGGDTQFSGRAEICLGGQFGTICDESWDNTDAKVFCSQLTGVNAAGAMAITGAGYGQATDLNILITQVGCGGAETELLNCPYTLNPSCGHHQDAGVICPEPCYVYGDIRLVNGSSTTQGRVEVCIGGLWSSICADETVCEDLGKLACSYLGFSSLRADVLGFAIYGESPGPVGIEGISCTADATNLTDCNFTSPSTCTHAMDAGLNCYEDSICLQAGHTDCCNSGGCYIFSEGCWCDSFCYFFNDCCEGIELTCSGPFGAGGFGSDGCSGIGSRLINGNDSSGIVQVCVDGKYSSVCNRGFGPEEAKIVCRSLGYDTEGFTITPTPVFGQAFGNVYQRDLSCDGNELDLTDCDGSDVCCGHQFDTGLVCQPACVHGEARLVGGTTNMEGRVEVCESGRWGTVCDDSWDYRDARVACKQANLPWKGAVAWPSSTFGNGIGPIFLDDVDCDGSEDSLFNCSVNTNHNCGHHEDAGVTCAPGPCELAGFIDTCCDPIGGQDCQGIDPTGVCHCSYDCHDNNDCCVDADFICSCTEGDLRLVDGSNEMEGRVEICLNSQWGTVCDDFWGAQDAKVVCAQLGFPTGGAEAFNFAFFGQGTGPIQLDNVQCDGTETYLLNCTHLQEHNCAHFEDASVRCNLPECTHGDIRLTGGTTHTEGQLDVCLDGVWGTVCDDFWDQTNSEVACAQLGLPSEGAIEVNSWQYFGFASGPINMDNVDCTGEETSLFDCDFISNHNCGHFEDVGLVCLESCSTEGAVRLVGGKFDNEGRVEICKNSQWTTICDDGWDNLDAMVACRSVGQKSDGARAAVNLQFGRGWGDISYTEFGCMGNEDNLTECTASPSTLGCSHFDDAGVQCHGICNEGDARLVDGNNNDTEGRVEICRNQTWGTICDNTNSWSTADAIVVCRQLQLPYTAAQSAYFGPGADPIHYADVDCSGLEQSLVSCDKDLTPTTCNHFDDVGVICEEACPTGAVTLVDGSEPTNGRVEVCLGGKWGTVCDHEWDHQDCQTICKQLSYPYEGAEAKFGAYFGQGDAHIAISQVHCAPTASEISDCIYSTGTDVSCSHANDASCICQDLCTNGAVRLLDGSGPTEGRVEICFNGEWGTVCDNGWTTADGQVVCRQLGFLTNDVRVFGSTKFGPGIGPIYYTNVQCNGDESALYFCDSTTDTDSCDHSEDVGLRCPGGAPVPTATPLATPTTPPPPACNDQGPDAVTDLVCNTTDTQIVIQWGEPANPNGIITYYHIDYTGTTFADDTILGNQPRQLLLPAQAPGVPVTVTITPANLFCDGDAAQITCYFSEATPNTPTVTGRRTSETTMVISWLALTPSQAKGYLLSYTLQYGPYDGTSSQVLGTRVLSIDQLSETITDLKLSQTYYARVLATNSAGNSSYGMTTVSTTDTTLFQLKMSLIEGQRCADYVLDSSNDKVIDIINQVSQEVSRRCSCSFTAGHITEGVFQCNPDEVDQVTFRARLYAVGTKQASEFTQYITAWVMDDSNSPVLIVQSVSLSVDPNCVVDIATFEDPLCGTQTSALALSTAATASIVVVVIIVVMVVLLIVVIIVVRRTRTKYQANNYADHEMVGYSNRMAFPEGEEGDNISQKMGSTVHDDDFQEAINIISSDIEQRHGDDDKARLAAEFGDN